MLQRFTSLRSWAMALLLAAPLLAGCGKKTDDATPAAGDGDGTLTWTYNGQTYTSKAYTGAFVQKGDEIIVMGTPDKNMGISLGIVGINAKGVGTYNLAASPNLDPIPAANFTTNALNSGNSQFYHTDYGSGASNGSIVVTQYDKAAQKLSGTFSFTAKLAGQGTATATITNGSFTITRFH